MYINISVLWAVSLCQVDIDFWLFGSSLGWLFDRKIIKFNHNTYLAEEWQMDILSGDGVYHE